MLNNRLVHAVRVVGNGFAFGCFFLGGLVLAVTVFPVIGLVVPPGSRRVRAAQKSIHFIFRGYLLMLRGLGIVALRVEGQERLRDPHPRLIVANHPTLLDVVLLMALVPRVTCIVKHELWTSRYLGGAVRAAGYIRNDLPTDELLGACEAVLAEGRSLIIFPEGTRSVPGQPLRFQRGFARIAAIANADIQLVTIQCVPPFLMKGDPWWRVPSRQPKFKVACGDTIPACEIDHRQHRSLTARHLVRRLESYFEERLRHG